MNLKEIFSVRNKYKGFRKWKIVKIFSFEFIFEVKRTRRQIIRYIQKNRPQKLPNSLDYSIDNKVYVSISAIYKNEPDIKEWIEYHKLIGVERFYLYDNESTDNSKEILKPYIEDGTVVYQYIKGNCMQTPCYRDAVYRSKGKTVWLAIIDLDEYICPVEKYKLCDVLREYEKHPALGINWVMFDSNNLRTRPKKLVIETYTRTHKNFDIPENHHIKSVVKPEEVKYITNPHYCLYKKKQTAVDENFEHIGEYNSYYTGSNFMTQKVSVKKIRINHYHTKSLEDYINKTNRGNADSKAKRRFIEEYLNFKNGQEDLIIQKYLPELKQKMGIN